MPADYTHKGSGLLLFSLLEDPPKYDNRKENTDGTKRTGSLNYHNGCPGHKAMCTIPYTTVGHSIGMDSSP